MCGCSFKFSNGRYHGRWIPKWRVYLCQACDRQNWDGIVIEQQPKFIEKLKANGVEIQLNPKGWLQIPSRGEF